MQLGLQRELGHAVSLGVAIGVALEQARRARAGEESMNFEELAAFVKSFPRGRPRKHPERERGQTREIARNPERAFLPRERDSHGDYDGRGRRGKRYGYPF